MPTMYKLVSQDWTTYNGMKWELRKWNEATHPGKEMCTNQVLHCYSDPRLAVLFNPIHTSIENPILLEIECDEIINTDGLKFACKKQKPTIELQIPIITINQKVAFAIKCALLFYKTKEFVQWAYDWLNGKDRTESAAKAAMMAAASAAWAATMAATMAAERAAASAAWAATMAAERAAESAAWAAESAARTAARAAESAAKAASAASAAMAAGAACGAAMAAESAARAAIGADKKAYHRIAQQFIEIIDWTMVNIK